jgi:hypothetical protein
MGLKDKPFSIKTRLIILAAIGFFAFIGLHDSQDASNLCGTEVGAWTMAKTAVKSRLRAPSTAEFPWYSGDYVRRFGNCRFVVNSHVDAQNGFGAMIRNRFTVELDYDGQGDSWRVGEIIVR